MERRGGQIVAVERVHAHTSEGRERRREQTSVVEKGGDMRGRICMSSGGAPTPLTHRCS